MASIEISVAQRHSQISSDKSVGSPVSAGISHFDVVDDPNVLGATVAINAIAERRLLLKCDLHILPILFVMYMFAFLDRINIGNARIQGMMKELNMTGQQYNMALLIFFVPYIMLEV